MGLKVMEDKLLQDQVSLAAEIERLRRENEMLNLNMAELTKTNEFLVSATWREREIKKKLRDALEELTETKKVVDEQHRSITDSINYASRIQDAIIPKGEQIKEKFQDAFLFHQSREVVSGDFPWLFENDQYIYVAAVDCTGHGVPGAMMSLIGHLLLNDLAKHQAIDPASLLTHLHWSVVRTLKQSGEGPQTADGMDVAMCRINPGAREIQFSGAHRPLFHVNKGSLTVYAGDKYPIGGNHYKGRNSFTNHTIRVAEGDSVYFFSDGLTDQFGGPEGQKFGTKRIKELLTASAHLTMEEQQERIRSAFESWKGDHRQIDDLLLVGIKF
jgi:serine phosphatase RsbU (regulator of sigma subunit)